MNICVCSTVFMLRYFTSTLRCSNAIELPHILPALRMVALSCCVQKLAAKGVTSNLPSTWCCLISHFTLIYLNSGSGDWIESGSNIPSIFMCQSCKTHLNRYYLLGIRRWMRLLNRTLLAHYSTSNLRPRLNIYASALVPQNFPLSNSLHPLPLLQHQ